MWVLLELHDSQIGRHSIRQPKASPAEVLCHNKSDGGITSKWAFRWKLYFSQLSRGMLTAHDRVHPRYCHYNPCTSISSQMSASWMISYLFPFPFPLAFWPKYAVMFKHFSLPLAYFSVIWYWTEVLGHERMYNRDVLILAGRERGQPSFQRGAGDESLMRPSSTWKLGPAFTRHSIFILTHSNKILISPLPAHWGSKKFFSCAFFSEISKLMGVKIIICLPTAWLVPAIDWLASWIAWDGTWAFSRGGEEE